MGELLNFKAIHHYHPDTIFERCRDLEMCIC